MFILLEIYYTPTSAIIADALAKTYEVVSLDKARNIAKKFKASLKQKTDLYVIEGILIDAGYKLVVALIKGKMLQLTFLLT